MPRYYFFVLALLTGLGLLSCGGSDATVVVGSSSGTENSSGSIRSDRSDSTGSDTSSISSTASSPGLSEETPDQGVTLRVHYNRFQEDYDNWGLHLWGDALDFTVIWEQPILFGQRDDYGVYVDIPVTYPELDLWFIPHRGDLKDGDDRRCPSLVTIREIWLIESVAAIFIARPNPENYRPNDEPSLLIHPEEYIELDDTRVKFLVRTDPGNSLTLAWGDTPDALTQTQSIDTFQAGRGMVVDGFRPGQNYFYRFSASNGEKTEESALGSFAKNGNLRTDTVAEWARQAIFYEILVRSFYDGNGDQIGDMAGLRQKIPYLKELGIDAVWLMPVFQSNSYHGYDVSDYLTIESDYGTNQDFRDFLLEAHRSGIRVIVDLVINHTSSRHPWFLAASSDRQDARRSFYVWQTRLDDVSETGPWGQQIWHFMNGTYYVGLFGSGMPDLNYRNQEVRQEIKNISRYWLDPDQDGDFSDGVDGFRLDAAMHIDNEDSDVTHHWWREWNAMLKSLRPDVFLVGENWTDTASISSFYADMDASFNFPLSDQLIAMANGHQVDILTLIDNMHEAYQVYSEHFIDATFLRNHDQNRVASDLGGSIPKIKLAASLLLTLPGAPFLYYGEELGQRGAKPDENIREPFDWYQGASGVGMTSMTKGGFHHSAVYTVANDGISLEEEQGKASSVFEHYKQLIAIRREYAQIFAGNYTQIETPASTYGYRITTPASNVNLIVIHNLAEVSSTLLAPENLLELQTACNYSRGEAITLEPFGSVILRSE
jgi:glycosidase